MAIPVVAVAEDAPPLKATARRTDDRVTVTVERDATIVAIHSPTGISQAEMGRTSDKWPDAIVLRLYLNGLEHVTASNGKLKLEASVSSQDGRVRQWKDGKEDSPLDSTSDDWMPIQRIPDKGCFELRLPRTLFQSNPKSITLRWIDFYRG